MLCAIISETSHQHQHSSAPCGALKPHTVNFSSTHDLIVPLSFPHTYSLSDYVFTSKIILTLSRSLFSSSKHNFRINRESLDLMLMVISRYADVFPSGPWLKWRCLYSLEDGFYLSLYCHHCWVVMKDWFLHFFMFLYLLVTALCRLTRLISILLEWGNVI